MTLPEHLRRAYRYLARPVGRRLVRMLDRRRLAEALAAEAVPQDRLPVFVVVVPGTLGWLAPCLKLLPADQPVWLLANGLSRTERRRLAEAFPQRRQFVLSVPPRAFARHGTVLDLVVAACPTDFVLLDHDCYVFDPALLVPVAWSDDEFLAGVDLPGFVNHNPEAGLKFPRTHFLIVRRERLLELAERFAVGCERVERAPARVRELLAEIGLGDGRMAVPGMPFFDTLKLATAVGLALGWRVRWLAPSEEAIRHIGGTARGAQEG